MNLFDLQRCLAPFLLSLRINCQGRLLGRRPLTKRLLQINDGQIIGDTRQLDHLHSNRGYAKIRAFSSPICSSRCRIETVIPRFERAISTSYFPLSTTRWKPINRQQKRSNPFQNVFKPFSNLSIRKKFTGLKILILKSFGQVLSNLLDKS